MKPSWFPGMKTQGTLIVLNVITVRLKRDLHIRSDPQHIARRAWRNVLINVRTVGIAYLMASILYLLKYGLHREALVAVDQVVAAAEVLAAVLQVVEAQVGDGSS